MNPVPNAVHLPADPNQAPMNPNLIKVGMVPVDPTPLEKQYAFFMSSGKTTTYIFRNGAKAVFFEGLVPGYTEAAFVTSVKGYVDELNEAIALHHPQLHTKKELITVTPEQMDPHDKIKKSAVEEYIKNDPDYQKYLLNIKGVGTPADSTTVQSAKLEGVASTASIAAAAAGSMSGAPAPIVLGK